MTNDEIREDVEKWLRSEFEAEGHLISMTRLVAQNEKDDLVFAKCLVGQCEFVAKFSMDGRTEISVVTPQKNPLPKRRS